MSCVPLTQTSRDGAGPTGTPPSMTHLGGRAVKFRLTGMMVTLPVLTAAPGTTVIYTQSHISLEHYQTAGGLLQQRVRQSRVETEKYRHVPKWTPDEHE